MANRHLVLAISASLATLLAVASATASGFPNAGFESGSTGWTVNTYLNPGIIVDPILQTRAELQLATGGTAKTQFLTSSGPGASSDPSVGSNLLKYPRYGTQAALVNQLGSGQNVNGLAQTFTVTSASVDPRDGRVHFRFVVAPVLQNPGHANSQQPYYFVQMTDLTTSTVLYSQFFFSGQAGVPWLSVQGGQLYYMQWQLIDISPPASVIGHNVQIELLAAGCSQGGHYGELYVDGGDGLEVPGIYVVGTAPAQVEIGEEITYVVVYRNGGSTDATGVVVNIATPPNTKFVSVTYDTTSRRRSVTCTSPSVGASGAVTCSVGSLPVDAFGNVTVTVSVNTGLPSGSSIVGGNYSVYSDQEAPLFGPRITTFIGCIGDAACDAGQWCNVSSNVCLPQLAVGDAIPTDSAHSPPINGICTAAAGQSVCLSGACSAQSNTCVQCSSNAQCAGGLICDTGANVCITPTSSTGTTSTGTSSTGTSSTGTSSTATTSTGTTSTGTTSTGTTSTGTTSTGTTSTGTTSTGTTSTGTTSTGTTSTGTTSTGTTSTGTTSTGTTSTGTTSTGTTSTGTTSTGTTSTGTTSTGTMATPSNDANGQQKDQSRTAIDQLSPAGRSGAIAGVVIGSCCLVTLVVLVILVVLRRRKQKRDNQDKNEHNQQNTSV